MRGLALRTGREGPDRNLETICGAGKEGQTSKYTEYMIDSGEPFGQSNA